MLVRAGAMLLAPARRQRGDVLRRDDQRRNLRPDRQRAQQRDAWDRFERHAGRKVAILNQGQGWATWDKAEVEATHARGAIPLVTMGLATMTLDTSPTAARTRRSKNGRRKPRRGGTRFSSRPGGR